LHLGAGGLGHRGTVQGDGARVVRSVSRLARGHLAGNFSGSSRSDAWLEALGAYSASRCAFCTSEVHKAHREDVG